MWFRASPKPGTSKCRYSGQRPGNTASGRAIPATLAQCRSSQHESRRRLRAPNADPHARVGWESGGRSSRPPDWAFGSSQVSAEKASDRLQRCGHPGQQHGLRIPPRILSMPTTMRRFLVASCLAEVTQQIHSFRASGVISAQRLFALVLDSMAFRKSAGSL